MKARSLFSPLTAVLLVLGLVAAGAGRALAHGEQIEMGGGGGPVKLTAEQQAAIGLKAEKADLRDIETLLVVNGKVKLDPNLHAHVSSRIEGRILKLFAKVGDRVEKGEKLAEIESRQIGNPPPAFTVEATVAGIVNERPVTVGDSVEPAKELFHVIDLSQVVVEAEVYEEDTGKVRLGQDSRIQMLGYSGETFEGKTTFIGLELDPEKRTLPVWISVKNPEGKLKPEMFAKAAIVLARGHGILAVPKEAVLEAKGEKFVFVQTGDTFTRVDVRTGAEDDHYVEIQEGLVPDDLVVTRGRREVYTSWLTGSGKPKLGIADIDD